MPEYFEGEMETHHFILDQSNNGITSCIVRQRWDKLLGRTLDCGSKSKHTITRTRGVSREQRQELEAYANSSFGVNYLAKLELQLTGTLGSVVTIQHEVTEENEFEFEVPNCFQRMYEVFQLKYIIRVASEWRPLLGSKKYWEKDLEVYTNEIYQRSRLTPWHRECGCGPGDIPRGGGVDLNGGGIGMSEPYVVTDSGLHLYTVGVLVTDDGVRPVDDWRGTGAMPTIPSAGRDWYTELHEREEYYLKLLTEREHYFTYGIFPRHLRFLVGASEEDIVAVRFREVAGQQLEVADTVGYA
jgi:hypothetical protein